MLRYIHQNPTEARIVKKIQAYPWSSYREYTKKQETCDTQVALNLFSRDSKEALSLWEKFNQENNNEKCLEYDDETRLNDLEATKLIQRIIIVKIPTKIQTFEKQKRNAVIKKLKNRGVLIRQISRLTGISFRVIRGI